MNESKDGSIAIQELQKGNLIHQAQLQLFSVFCVLKYTRIRLEKHATVTINQKWTNWLNGSKIGFFPIF